MSRHTTKRLARGHRRSGLGALRRIQDDSLARCARNGDVAEEYVCPREVGGFTAGVGEVVRRLWGVVGSGSEELVDLLTLVRCPRPQAVVGVGVRQAAADAAFEYTEGAFGDRVGVGDVRDGEGTLVHELACCAVLSVDAITGELAPVVSVPGPDATVFEPMVVALDVGV
eukprot:scaffold28765_cov112-Isochrysis_galbana.AAC.1